MLQVASNRKNSGVNALFQELFRTTLYKRNQGRVVRQGTFAAIVVIVVFGAWRLGLTAGMWGLALEWQLGLPAVLIAAGAWIAFRLINVPEVADFLISVEAEMRKVSWPKRSELIRGCVVVLVVIFSLALILTVYDLFWRSFFGWLNIY
ncbi:MAG: preprotein translocase subunit SecE [Thermogutta sp.]|nr:preprotein translocase subunit SecE [Thermogutta sp.]